MLLLAYNETHKAENYLRTHFEIHLGTNICRDTSLFSEYLPWQKTYPSTLSYQPVLSFFQFFLTVFQENLKVRKIYLHLQKQNLLQ